MRKTGWLFFLIAALAAGQARVTLSLNGTWDIEESESGDAAPASFGHKIPVPGLADLAEPAFPDAGSFLKPDQVIAQINQKLLPESAKLKGRGFTKQTRRYFWYRTRFKAPSPKQTAVLRIGKAQFGTAVWLNGKKIGEHLGCFTSGTFDLTAAMDWKAENELVVRVGAHPAVLPEHVPSGTDPSRRFWYPGIYDNVTLVMAGSLLIEMVQVAPRVETSEVVVQTELHNRGPAGAFPVRHRLPGAPPVMERVQLAQGERKTLRHTLKLASPVLWTPERPHLYQLVTSTGSDEVTTRFGMRELRFDTATRRAYLNGKPYFFRGSNVALHRFFEDPKRRRLPWDEKWVRKAMAEIPKRLNWNSIRFHVGPPPDQWLDIADELGIVVFNEYPIFGWDAAWTTEQMITEYREWMRDQWNHPSVVMWDASNETRTDKLTPAIRAVRKEDLSNRAWDNGYNLPDDPNDPVEDHPYLFHGLGTRFQLADLERMTGAKTTNAPHPTAHASIINEYEWIWLQRDGNPTRGTREVWSKLLPESASPAERLDLRAYLVGGLTEFWRAHRNAAGVIHFAYLSYSVPYSNSSDCFEDIEKLVLEPKFEDYATEAFRPLGVYLNFWQPKLKAGAERSFAVMLANDEGEAAAGTLVLSLDDAKGAELARRETAFELPAYGQHTYALTMEIPAAAAGECLVKATAHPAGGKTPTVSRRRVAVTAP